MLCTKCQKDKNNIPFEAHLFKKLDQEVAGSSYQGSGMLSAASVTTTYNETYQPAGVRSFFVCRKCLNQALYTPLISPILCILLFIANGLLLEHFYDVKDVRMILGCTILFALLFALNGIKELFMHGLMLADRKSLEQLYALEMYYPEIAGELGHDNVAFPREMAGIGQLVLKTSGEARAMRPVGTPKPKDPPLENPGKVALISFAIQCAGLIIATLAWNKVIAFPMTFGMKDPKGFLGVILMIIIVLGQLLLLAGSILLPLLGYWFAFEAIQERKK